MPSGKKKGKLTSGEGFTLGADESLGMSIGALFRGNGTMEHLPVQRKNGKSNILFEFARSGYHDSPGSRSMS